MGKGKLKSLDKTFKYNGQFIDGNMHGKGKIVLKESGNEFEG